MQTKIKKPNPDALDLVTKIISDLHKIEPSDEFIKRIEDTEMSKSKYQEPKQIIEARARAAQLNQFLIRYKSFYRKRLNDETWRQTSIRQTWEYYKIKREINLLYYILQQHNKLKKQHALLNKKPERMGGC